MVTAICLTTDIDWACDEVLLDLNAALEQRGLKATWFVTHSTSVLDQLRASGYELGIHPNFNPLLSGQSPKSFEDVLDTLFRIVPEAHSVRAHSTVQSSRLTAAYVSRGFTHESNILMPYDQVGLVPAWRDAEGIIKVPYAWTDDVFVSSGRTVDLIAGLRLPGIFTVDFHPIHFFLNTVTMDEYEECRPHFEDPDYLRYRRRPAGSGGVRDQLEQLFDAIASKSIPMRTVAEIEPE